MYSPTDGPLENCSLSPILVSHPGTSIAAVLYGERTDTAMSFFWISAAGLTAAIIAKLLMPNHGVGGLFILGFGGSIIAAVMQYSLNQPIGWIASLIGAFILLAIYAATPGRPVAQRTSDETQPEDFRRAA